MKLFTLCLGMFLILSHHFFNFLSFVMLLEFIEVMLLLMLMLLCKLLMFSPMFLFVSVLVIISFAICALTILVSNFGTSGMNHFSMY